MAALVLTSQLNIIVQELLSSDFLTPDEKESLRKDEERKMVSNENVKLISKYLHSQSKKLVDVVKGSKIVFPNLMEKPVETPAHVLQRRQQLQIKQQEREYNKMIYGQYENPNIEKMLSKGNHYASMRNQVSISMNMIVSMGACYGIAYYVGMQMGKESSTENMLARAQQRSGALQTVVTDEPEKAEYKDENQRQKKTTIKKVTNPTFSLKTKKNQ